MTRIERRTQKIFAGNAATDELAVFGSMNTGNPIYTDNIETLQSTNYEEGWSSAIAANEAPWLEELNGVQYGLSKQIAYQFQEGIAEYDAGTAYFAGSWCKSLTNNIDGQRDIYQSLTDNNLNNPLTDTVNWKKVELGGANKDLSNLSETGQAVLDAKANTDLSNLSETGQAVLEAKANTDLTNLTPAGEKHFVNKSQITNCILEAPERIKYTLEGGTLTIKAGSVVIVPYGTQDLSAQFPVGSTFINENFQVYDSQYSDGKFFVWVKLVNDLSADRNTEDVYRRTLFIIFSDTASDVPLQAGINSSSGTTVPKDGYLYNTSTNKVSYYNTSSELTYETCSLPLGIVKANGEIVFSSIEQMFHSVGYIGGLAWIDKGIKALMPNGRNSDRTINNLHYETPELMFYDQTGLTGLRSLILRADNTFNSSVGYHVGDDGYLHQDDHIYSKFIGFEFANITAESGQILSIVPRNAFQAANAQDLDGVWMKNSVLLADNLSLSTGDRVKKIFDLSAFLPNDGKLYEVLVSGSANLGNVNGAYINCSIYSPDINIWTRLMVARNTASSNCAAGGSALNLIGSLRKLIISTDTKSPVKLTLSLEAYRKVR